MIPSSWYNVLKPVTTTILPGVAALYLTLDAIWDVPAEEKVAATIAAANVFLGLLINVSSRAYNHADSANPSGRFDGDVKTDGRGLWDMELNRPVSDLVGTQDELRLKLNSIA